MRASIPAVVLVHGEAREVDPWASAAALAALEPEWRAAQADFTRQFARASFAVADHTGHLIASERPDLVASAVLEVERLAAAAKSD